MEPFTLTVKTFFGSPYAGTYQVWWVTSCIDYQWELLAPIEVLVADDDRPWVHGASAELQERLIQKTIQSSMHLGGFIQALCNCGLSDVTDLTEIGVVSGLEGNDIVFKGIAWKVDSNGSSFIALKQKYAHEVQTFQDGSYEFHGELIVEAER